MLVIELTNDYVEGEPGPNFYWRGLPSDFFYFTSILTNLIDSKGEYCILKNDDIDLIGISRISISVVNGANCLVGVDNDKVSVSLDRSYMEKVIDIFKSISEKPSHNFVEFDFVDLKEQANWIISSDCS